MGTDMVALPVDSATEFKMGISSIMRRIWNARDDGRPPPPDGSSPTAWSKIFDALQRASQSFLQTFFIFSLFLACLGIAAVQAGAYLTVVIATLSILTASVVTFDIVLALGYATLPLIYFRSFDRLWSQYLIVCVALALIPCFFYVFSSIGFVFATSTFEILFPLSDPATAAGGASFSAMLTSIFLGAAYTLVSCSHGILPQVWGTMFGNTVSMAEGMVFFGKMFVGSLIVATFVGIGTSFAGLAPLIATRWNSGFGGEQVFTSVRTGIGSLRETLPSQIAQVYSGGIEQAQAMANAAGRTAGTLISKWRRK
jgi:hypothetical protein